MNWWPGYMDEEDLDLDLYDQFELSDGNVPKVDIDWRDAVEQNKTRDTCVLCGKETIEKPLYTSVIRYCPCVEEHIKKERGTD